MGFKDSLESVVLHSRIVRILLHPKDPIPWWDSRILWSVVFKESQESYDLIGCLRMQ